MPRSFDPTFPYEPDDDWLIEGGTSDGWDDGWPPIEITAPRANMTRNANEYDLDENGIPVERRWTATGEVIVHFEDIPACDRTTIDGIPVTTALRTVIDLAPTVTRDHLERMVDDCLTRGLFTLDEARDRLAQDDMRFRPGAIALRRLIAFCGQWPRTTT
jgi:hypothetical protein